MKSFVEIAAELRAEKEREKAAQQAAFKGATTDKEARRQSKFQKDTSAVANRWINVTPEIVAEAFDRTMRLYNEKQHILRSIRERDGEIMTERDVIMAAKEHAAFADELVEKEEKFFMQIAHLTEKEKWVKTTARKARKAMIGRVCDKIVREYMESRRFAKTKMKVIRRGKPD